MQVGADLLEAAALGWVWPQERAPDVLVDAGRAEGAGAGWSIRKSVKTARRCRTIEIQAGRQTITAADPLPDRLRQALDAIHHDN